MSKSGERIIAGTKQAVAIAKGDEPAAVLRWHGRDYVPAAALRAAEARIAQLEREFDSLKEDLFSVMDGRTTEADARVAAEAVLDQIRRFMRTGVGDRTALGCIGQVLDKYDARTTAKGGEAEPAEQDYVFVHHCDANISVQVERGKHGLYYGTSPDVKGLIVAGDSVDDVLANVPKAVDDLRAAKGETK